MSLKSHFTDFFEAYMKIRIPQNGWIFNNTGSHDVNYPDNKMDGSEGVDDHNVELIINVDISEVSIIC